MGGSRTQKNVHRFVLSDVTGRDKARAEAVRLTKFGLGIAALTSVLIITIAAAANQPMGGALSLALGVLLAALPFASVALEQTTGFSLRKQQLRLKHLLVGRKHYRLSEDRITLHDDTNKPVSADIMRELELLQVAGSLVYDEPALIPNNGVAAWEWFGTFAELPGVAIGFNRYGAAGQTYAFVYGQPTIVLEHAKEIWDLGHVRRIGEADKEAIKKTRAAWKRNGDTTLALAYAHLPTDIDITTLTAKEITAELTLLGLIGLHGTREYGASFPIDPSEAIRTAARSSLSSSLAVSLMTALSYLGFVLFDIPLALSLMPVLVLKLAIELLPIASLAWDHVRPGKKLRSTHLIKDAAEAGLTAGSLAYMNYLFYFSRHGLGITTIATGSIAHNGAMALALLSLGLCVLVDIVMHRSYDKTLTRYQLYNPLFLLGCASAMLALLMATYQSGSLAWDDLWFGVIAAMIFIAIRKLLRYANTHHGRDHIIELLKTS